MGRRPPNAAMSVLARPARLGPRPAQAQREGPADWESAALGLGAAIVALAARHAVPTPSATTSKRRPDELRPEHRRRLWPARHLHGARAQRAEAVWMSPEITMPHCRQDPPAGLVFIHAGNACHRSALRHERPRSARRAPSRPRSPPWRQRHRSARWPPSRWPPCR